MYPLELSPESKEILVDLRQYVEAHILTDFQDMGDLAIARAAFEKEGFRFVKFLTDGMVHVAYSIFEKPGAPKSRRLSIKMSGKRGSPMPEYINAILDTLGFRNRLSYPETTDPLFHFSYIELVNGIEIDEGYE